MNVTTAFCKFLKFFDLVCHICPGVDFVQVGRCQDIYTSLLETVARNNGLQNKTSIKWVELEKTFEPLPLLWDIVLCDVVSPQGILRPAVFEEIGAVRYDPQKCP